MEAIPSILAFVTGGRGPGRASISWGVHSPEPYPDDRRR